MTTIPQNTLKNYHKQTDDLSKLVNIFERFLDGIFNFVFIELINGACSEITYYNIDLYTYIQQFKRNTQDVIQCAIDGVGNDQISISCNYQLTKHDNAYIIGYSGYNNTEIDYNKLREIYNNNNIKNNDYKLLPYVKIQLSKECYRAFANGNPATLFITQLEKFYNNVTTSPYEQVDIENNITCKLKIFKIELNNYYVFMMFLDNPLYNSKSKYCFDNHNKVETIKYDDIKIKQTLFKNFTNKLLKIYHFIVDANFKYYFTGFIFTVITGLFTAIFTKYI